MDSIHIRGAREHNLKNIDLEIPRNRLVVITGVSGSGKSSLAFDTLYAEGQRRYVESLSAYARQFLQQMEKPDVGFHRGLSPAISIEQKSVSRNPRSTVGTVIEIHDYLRLLFASVGTPHCPNCGQEIRPQTVQQMVDRVMALPAGSRLVLYAPMCVARRVNTRSSWHRWSRRASFGPASTARRSICRANCRFWTSRRSTTSTSSWTDWSSSPRSSSGWRAPSKRLSRSATDCWCWHRWRYPKRRCRRDTLVSTAAPASPRSRQGCSPSTVLWGVSLLLRVGHPYGCRSGQDHRRSGAVPLGGSHRAVAQQLEVLAHAHDPDPGE